MYVLDTNVASELMEPTPEPAVTTWFAGRNATDMCLTAISKAELLYGVAIVPPGKRKNQLEAIMNHWLNTGFGGRILPFDNDAAQYYAEIASHRREVGRPIQTADCQIAAICRLHSAVLVTRNVRDFKEAGINLVNPWTET